MGSLHGLAVIDWIDVVRGTLGRIRRTVKFNQLNKGASVRRRMICQVPALYAHDCRPITSISMAILCEKLL